MRRSHGLTMPGAVVATLGGEARMCRWAPTRIGPAGCRSPEESSIFHVGVGGAQSGRPRSARLGGGALEHNARAVQEHGALVAFEQVSANSAGPRFRSG